MLYGIYKIDDDVVGDFYDDFEQWHKATFSPNTEILTLIDFTVHGDSYRSRKADVQQKAVEYSHSWASGADFSWGDVAIFTGFFSVQGQRYGLLKEFRENGII